MSALKDSDKLLHQGLNSLSRLLDADTEVSTVDLNLLENLNTNQSLNYIKLEEKLDQIQKNKETLKALDEEFQAYMDLIDDLDKSTLKLESLVGQAEQWAKDLEKKIGN